MLEEEKNDYIEYCNYNSLDIICYNLCYSFSLDELGNTFPRKSNTIKQMTYWSVYKGVDMPVFEFVCESCGKVVEVIQRYEDNPPKCECGGKTKRKLSVGNVAFDFRGKGFYATDYKRQKCSK